MQTLKLCLLNGEVEVSNSPRKFPKSWNELEVVDQQPWLELFGSSKCIEKELLYFLSYLL